MQSANLHTNALSDLIEKAHSPYHSCAYCINILKENDFEELSLSTPWQLKKAGKYFVNVYDSTCIAFTLGSALTEIPDLRMLTAHTDWPTFMVKPNPDMAVGQYHKLNVEPYGGIVYSSWLDRPLGIAGKVCTKGTDPFHPDVHLVDSNVPVALIPGLAIHMNNEINNGLKLNPQLHMLPIISLQDENDKTPDFLSYLADLADVNREDILDYELCLYNDDPATICGTKGEFFSAPRIDNCSGVQAALNAILGADTNSNLICISAFYHNEEVGSTTKQGADSSLTISILERIFENLGYEKEALRCTMSKGLCLSMDTAHGMHPNFTDKNDVTNQVCLGEGVAIKLSSRQAYATDATYISVIQALCKKHNIPYSKYVNRSDIKGGATLGSISSALLNIPCVDVGVPVLSMHSARELMACEDQSALCALAMSLFQNT